MANRKQFLGDLAADPELVRMLEETRKTPITDAELLEQRISFAFGNSPADSEFITKEVRSSGLAIDTLGGVANHRVSPREG